MSATDRGRRPRIAVVDDEEDVLTFLQLAFEDRGFEVLATDRPTGALARLAAFRPDVVCLDLLMPEQLGVSLYGELRAHPDLARVPVLILSGLSPQQGLAAVVEQGAALPAPAAYIEKPIVIDELMHAVEQALAASLEVPA